MAKGDTAKVVGFAVARAKRKLVLLNYADLDFFVLTSPPLPFFCPPPPPLIAATHEETEDQLDGNLRMVIMWYSTRYSI